MPKHHELNGHGGQAPRVLFIQATEPAGYPPLINAAMLMAEVGWDATFLSAPIAGNRMEVPAHPRIGVRSIPVRPSHVMGKLAYFRYTAAAIGLGLRLRPDVVYASDPLGAGPGLLAAKAAGASLVYHEHDSPAPGSLRPFLARARVAAGREAQLVVFPNEVRGRIAQAEIGFAADRLHIVWNLPRRAELPPLHPRPEGPLVVYYHGSITPARLPLAFIEAIRAQDGRVRLLIAGREAPGAQGYLQRLIELGGGPRDQAIVEYAGQVPDHADLVAVAALADIGLALVPATGNDLNMRHMTGASNKPFDYMAAGLALLVTDLPEWCAMFVEPGYARACNPADPVSIAAALAWFLDHAHERQAMGGRGRARIEAEWNYEAAFALVMATLSKSRWGELRLNRQPRVL
jgi:glycosyltransferase involved in cell wall biosynthesis